jgi:hypothetical protein
MSCETRNVHSNLVGGKFLERVHLKDREEDGCKLGYMLGRLVVWMGEDVTG